MAADIEVNETNIKDVIKALQDLLNNIDKIADDTLQEIVKKGETYLEARYVTRFKDPNITDISTNWRKDSDGYVLEATGKDVVYEEFGITSGKFWIYSKDGSTLYYTQGVPAGKEMWDTRNYLLKTAIPEIGKRKGKEIREKFEKSIKK